MSVLDDRIGSAWGTIKMHANSTGAFNAGPQGDLGYFIDSRPLFYGTPCRPNGDCYFDIKRLDCNRLPEVVILFGHAGAKAKSFKSAVAARAKGVVLSAMGSGSWTTQAGRWIAQCVNRTGITVTVCIQV